MSDEVDVEEVKEVGALSLYNLPLDIRQKY
jgi:hypothetical protein